MFLSIFFICLILRFALLAIMGFVGKKSYQDMEKISPFECGFISYEESRSPFSAHFFIVGLIFLIFDVELILLYPYLGRLTTLIQRFNQLLVLGFLFILSGGLLLEWEKSILEWSK